MRIPALIACFTFAAPITLHAQEQTVDQQKCTVAMEVGFQKIGAALAKNGATCLKDGSKGTLAGAVEPCLSADAQGKVAAAAAKTAADFDKRCTGTSPKDPASPRLPPWGVTDSPTVAAAAHASVDHLIDDVIGTDVDAVLALEVDDVAAAKCQQEVAKRVAKCRDARVKEFGKCAKAGLQDDDAPFASPGDLAGCIGADPKAKIAKTCDLRVETKPGTFTVDGIRKALATTCQAKGVGLDVAAPACGGGDIETVHTCLAAAVACHTCRALDAAGALGADCDLLDDGAANGTCIAAAAPIGRHTCTFDPNESGFLFDTSVFTDVFAIAGRLDVDCGAIDPGTGGASCTCTVVDIPPVAIVPNIGVACVYPSPGCAAGEITCPGGPSFDGALTSHHAIGTCTGRVDCAAQCATRCGSDGAEVWDSACEGFCRGGNDDAVCAIDAECLDGGTCTGITGGTHGNVCQCECLDRTGEPALPGALRCNVGVAIDVELSAPCGEGNDLLFSIPPRCIPFTTERTEGIVRDANAVVGQTIPTQANQSFGRPISCTELASNGTSGLALAAAVQALDVDLAGDIAFLFSLSCQ